jgi:hypothetical protein
VGVGEELGYGTFERGQTDMDLNHLVRTDWLRWVDAGLVLGPLVSALAAVEKVAVDP